MNELLLEIFILWDILDEVLEGSREWELCLCFVVFLFIRRGFLIVGNDFGVCFFVKDEKEFLNFDNEELFKKLGFGDGRFLYRLIDCLIIL